MTSYTKIIDNDLASGALYDKVNDMADALNAGKLERSAFGLRKASTAYVANSIVLCEYHGDLLLKCTTAGTTGVGALDTSGSLSAGATISDGTVVWTAITKGSVRSVNGNLPDTTGEVHVTIESGWNLLDHKRTDHILNDIRWLRGNTFSWQDGNVYTSAYNALVDDIDGIASSTETVGSYTITYYQAASGRKIVLPAMENTVNNIYNESGAAWYYILDTTNTRFKLPRPSQCHGEMIKSYSSGTNWYRIYEDGWCEQGGTANVGANSQYNGTFLKPFKDTNICFLATDNSSALDGGVYGFQQGCGVSSNSAFYLRTAYDSTVKYTWQACGYISGYFNDIEKYLYFYVGNYTQSAVEQTAGLNSELFADKLDLSAANATSTTASNIINSSGSATKETVNGWAFPDYSSGTPITSGYQAPSNGFLIVQAYVNGGHAYGYIDGIQIYHWFDDGNSRGTSFIPISKGSVWTCSSGFEVQTFYPCLGG